MHVLAHTLELAPLGGVEISTLQDVLALRERGHRIDIAYGADGPLRATYTSAGVGLQGPYRFSFDPRTAVRDLPRFVPAVRDARRAAADVLWLSRSEHLVWGRVVARGAGLPLVAHLHGPPVLSHLRLLGRGVAHFIAVSDFVRDAYLAEGIPPNRITRIHNAVPPAAYPFGGQAESAAARASLGLPQGVPLVLCYGQMSVDKGLLTLLAAWRLLTAEVSDAVLVLVDSTSDRPDPAVQAVLAGLDPRSYRVFPVATDVVPYLHAVDVVAFPTWLPEAFGRVVIEAMATGRPAVASRIGALPEVLDDRWDRFLVAPRDAAQLAAKLVEVLTWRRDQPSLGEECAARVAERFRFSDHVSAVEQVLLDNRRRSRQRRGDQPPA
jgi:glycosyltransferase involved in cell wall biosynthesis